MRIRRRATVRRRLALALASLIIGTGAALLAASYLLVGNNLNNTLPERDQAIRGPVILNGDPPAVRAPSSVLVGSRNRTVARIQDELLVQYGVALGILTLVGGLVAWVVAGRVLRPLRAITAGAHQMTHERLGERLSLTGPDDELKELGDTFDAMLARLQVAFETQQLFAANAAHELRTPLAVLHGELELALTGPELSVAEQRDLASKLLRTVTASQRLTDRLLVLARGEVAPTERTVVRLDELVRDQLSAARPVAEHHGLTVSADLKPAEVHGDRALLAQLIENLIENAIKHNRRHGWVRLRVTAGEGNVVLVVANSGARLAEQQLPALMEPFRRANQQRVGDSPGLGLSIVRTISDAHEGRVALTAVANGGLEVRVTLAGGARATRRGGHGQRMSPQRPDPDPDRDEPGLIPRDLATRHQARCPARWLRIEPGFAGSVAASPARRRGCSRARSGGGGSACSPSCSRRRCCARVACR